MIHPCSVFGKTDAGMFSLLCIGVNHALVYVVGEVDGVLLLYRNNLLILPILC